MAVEVKVMVVAGPITVVARYAAQSVDPRVGYCALSKALKQLSALHVIMAPEASFAAARATKRMRFCILDINAEQELMINRDMEP